MNGEPEAGFEAGEEPQADLESTRLSLRRIAARRQPAMVMDLTQVSRRRANRDSLPTPPAAASPAALDAGASVPGVLGEDEAFPTQSDPEVTRPSTRRRTAQPQAPGAPTDIAARAAYQPTEAALEAERRTPVRATDASSKPVLRFGPGWGVASSAPIERSPEEIALRRYERGRHFAIGTLVAMAGTVALILVAIWALASIRF